VLAMSQKQKWPVTDKDVDGKWLDGKKLSGADIESMLVAAMRKSLLDGNAKDKRSYLEKAAADFIPATSALEVQFQELAAVIECTDRSFLPDGYRKQDRSDLLKEFHRLQALVEG